MNLLLVAHTKTNIQLANEQNKRCNVITTGLDLLKNVDILCNFDKDYNINYTS